jgi:PTS system nitrogen regulatory IIA component
VWVHIADVLRPDCVIADLSGGTVSSVLAELARPAAAAGVLEPAALASALLAREKLGSTGIGEGVAVPHCKVPHLAALTACLGRSRAGVDFRAHDGKPTHLFVALFAPERAGAEHLQALARVSPARRAGRGGHVQPGRRGGRAAVDGGARVAQWQVSTISQSTEARTSRSVHPG